MLLQLNLANNLVLKDNAWYTKDVSSLKRLNYYMDIGHTENINHLSQAGLFKANIGTRSIDGHLVIDDCDLMYVKFYILGQQGTYYTFVYDVQGPITKVAGDSYDVGFST